MMGVFNNLVMYDQNVPQNNARSIVRDSASSWSWNEEGRPSVVYARYLNSLLTQWRRCELR